MKNIILVGCGGTGSYIVYYLARLLHLHKDNGKKINLIIIDGDIVEEKNLLRQNFIPRDLGRNKAEVLAERYSNAFGVNIEYVDKHLEDPQELLRIKNYIESFGSKTVIVGAVDNGAARRLMHEVIQNYHERFYYRDLLYIDAGNAATTSQVVVGGRFGAMQGEQVMNPLAGQVFPNLLEDDEDDEDDEVSCADLSLQDGQTITANVMTATMVYNAISQIVMEGTVPFHIAVADITTGAIKTTPTVREVMRS